MKLDPSSLITALHCTLKQYIGVVALLPSATATRYGYSSPLVRITSVELDVAVNEIERDARQVPNIQRSNLMVWVEPVSLPDGNGYSNKATKVSIHDLTFGRDAIITSITANYLLQSATLVQIVRDKCGDSGRLFTENGDVGVS
jgi:hypothetical protein